MLSCDEDWLNGGVRLDERDGFVTVTAVEDRSVQKRLGGHLCLGHKTPQLPTGLIVDRLTQVIASTRRRCDHQHRERRESRLRKMPSMPLPIREFGEPFRLHRRDAFDTRRIAILFEVIDLLVWTA